MTSHFNRRALLRSGGVLLAMAGCGGNGNGRVPMAVSPATPTLDPAEHAVRALVEQVSTVGLKALRGHVNPEDRAVFDRQEVENAPAEPYELAPGSFHVVNRTDTTARVAGTIRRVDQQRLIFLGVQGDNLFVSPLTTPEETGGLRWPIAQPDARTRETLLAPTTSSANAWRRLNVHLGEQEHPLISMLGFGHPAQVAGLDVEPVRTGPEGSILRLTAHFRPVPFEAEVVGAAGTPETRIVSLDGRNAGRFVEGLFGANGG